MVGTTKTIEATDAASNGQAGGTGSPTLETVATSLAEDATPRAVEFRRRWRTVYTTTTQLQAAERKQQGWETGKPGSK